MLLQHLLGDADDLAFHDVADAMHIVDALPGIFFHLLDAEGEALVFLVDAALREWMSESGASAKVAVTFYGKWKTTVQIFGISMMLYQQDIGPLPIYRIGEILLYIAAGLTILSMLDYLRSAWPVLRDSK